MSKATQDGRVFSVAAHKLAISHLPCGLTEEGIKNLLPQSAQCHLIDLRLVQGKKESKGLNAAFITLSSASAREDVMTKLHETPPLNLVVTPVASWKDRLEDKQKMGEQYIGREEALEDENNNAAEEVFVFGSPLVLDVTGDEIPPCGGCSGLAGLVCAGCPGLSPAYCSRSCQVKDWPTHKEQCGNKVQALIRGGCGTGIELESGSPAGQGRGGGQGCSSAVLKAAKTFENLEDTGPDTDLSGGAVQVSCHGEQHCVQKEIQVRVNSGNAKKSVTHTEPDQRTVEGEGGVGVAQVIEQPKIEQSTVVGSQNLDGTGTEGDFTCGKKGAHFSQLGEVSEAFGGENAEQNAVGGVQKIEESCTSEKVGLTDPAEQRVRVGAQQVTQLLQEKVFDNDSLSLGLRELRTCEGKTEVQHLGDPLRSSGETSIRPEAQGKATREPNGKLYDEIAIYGSSNRNSDVEKGTSKGKSDANNPENQAACPPGQQGGRSLGLKGHSTELENVWTSVSSIQPTSVFTFLLAVGNLPSPVPVKLANCAPLVEESEAATEVVKDILASQCLWVRRLEGTATGEEGFQQVELKTEQGNDVAELLVEFGLVQIDPEQLFSGQGKVHRFMQGEWDMMWRGEVLVVRCQGGFLLKVQGPDASHVLFDSRVDKLLWTKVKSRKFYWNKGGEGVTKEQWVVVLASPQEVMSLAEMVGKLAKRFENNILDVKGEVELTGSAPGKQNDEVSESKGTSGSFQPLKDCDLLARESDDLAMPGLKSSSKSSLQEDEDKEEVRMVSSVELEDPARFSTCMPGIGGRLNARLLHIDSSSSNFFVCGEKEWGELITFQEELQEKCNQFQGKLQQNGPVQPQLDHSTIHPLQLVVFCSSQDSMWYRGIVKKVHKGTCKLFCPDYGFTEKVEIGSMKLSVKQSIAQLPFFARPCRTRELLRTSIEVGMQMALEVTNKEGVLTEVIISQKTFGEDHVF